MSELPKVYVFATSKWGGDVVVIGVCESGRYLGSHVCSNMSWARHDMTGTPSRRESIEEEYPDGYEVVVLPEGEGPPDEVTMRNHALARGPEDGPCDCELCAAQLVQP